MASRRNLKKDINYLTSQIIGECYSCKYLFPKIDSAQIMNIINDSVLMYNNLIYKVNNPNIENENLSMKLYYKNIFKELLSNTDTLFERLNKLTPND
jgi:hypothetical protein